MGVGDTYLVLAIYKVRAPTLQGPTYGVGNIRAYEQLSS